MSLNTGRVPVPSAHVQCVVSRRERGPLCRCAVAGGFPSPGGMAGCPSAHRILPRPSQSWCHCAHADPGAHTQPGPARLHAGFLQKGKLSDEKAEAGGVEGGVDHISSYFDGQKEDSGTSVSVRSTEEPKHPLPAHARLVPGRKAVPPWCGGRALPALDF